MVSLSKYHLLAMVVPGPSEPKCWDAYHKALGQQLQRLSQGVRVCVCDS
jgi:hypothetical protein